MAVEGDIGFIVVISTDRKSLWCILVQQRPQHQPDIQWGGVPISIIKKCTILSHSYDSLLPGQLEDGAISLTRLIVISKSR